MAAPQLRGVFHRHCMRGQRAEGSANPAPAGPDRAATNGDKPTPAPLQPTRQESVARVCYGCANEHLTCAKEKESLPGMVQ